MFLEDCITLAYSPKKWGSCDCDVWWWVGSGGNWELKTCLILSCTTFRHPPYKSRKVHHWGCRSQGWQIQNTNIKISPPPQKVIFHWQNANLLTFCWIIDFGPICHHSGRLQIHLSICQQKRRWQICYQASERDNTTIAALQTIQKFMFSLRKTHNHTITQHDTKPTSHFTHLNNRSAISITNKDAIV